DEVEHLRKGQRQHREVDAAPAQAEEPDQRAADHRRTEPDAEREPDRGQLELRQRDAGTVCAEPVVGGVAEREEPRVAVEEIEPQREQTEDQDLGGERLVGHEERKHGEEGDEGRHGMRRHPRRHRTERRRDHSASPASPKSPLGRTRSTTAITMKTMSSASLAAKNVVRLTISPLTRPATLAPATLPIRPPATAPATLRRPPTRRITTESMMISTPSPAWTPRIGPARTPASPAMPMPIPKTISQIRLRSTPSARTISASREPARMMSPMFVFSRKSQSDTSTAAVTAMTNRRETGKYMKPRVAAAASRLGGAT